MSKFASLRDGKEEGIQLEFKELEGQVLTATSCKLKNTKNGECSVWRFKEFKEGFYFGGQVLTELCKAIEKDEDLQKELADGIIKFKLVEKKSEKSDRPYIDYEVVE